MDRRKIRSKNGATGLKLRSTGNSNDPKNPGTSASEGEISSKAESFSNFRPVFTSSVSSKRKKSQSSEIGSDNEPELSFEGRNLIALKKRRSGKEPENVTQEREETSRAPSRLSNFTCSQVSTRSRESNTSKLLRLASKQMEAQNNVEASVQVHRTPEKESDREKSILPSTSNDEETDRLLICEKSPHVSPQKLLQTEPRMISPRRSLLQHTTPLKEVGNESDASDLFGSNSSSAKKRGRFSLSTPGDKDINLDVNADARSNVSRKILNNQVGSEIGSPARGSFHSTPREANASRKRLLDSPIRPVRREVEFESPRPVQSKNSFVSFLRAVGVTLIEGDNPHEINADPNVIRNRMKIILQSQDRRYRKNDIVEEWKKYIENEEDLKKAATNLKVVNDETPFPSWFVTSLIKLLLNVSEIQKPFLEILLEKINEIILMATEPENVAWTTRILEQLRFLEAIEDPESMTSSIEHLLEITPIWFQRELIQLLPDIVVDSQHHATAEMLVKLLEISPDLTNVILDSITTLSIGKEYFEELRIKVINMLVVCDPDTVPVIIRFVLSNCDEERPAVKVLQTLRMVHLEPLETFKEEDCFTNQMNTINILTSMMTVSKKIIHAMITVVRVADGIGGGLPMDLIFILLLFSFRGAKKSVETIFKQHLRSGYYRTKLLKIFYKDYPEVARHFQTTALNLASNLLTSDDQLYTDFGIEWFILMIVSQERLIKQREVLDKMMDQVGFNNLTAKNCFKILSKMIADNEKQQFLQPHCNHLKGLLDKVENLDLESVAIMSDVLHGLCSECNSSSESLQTDLFILMNKQLWNSNSLTKCKGVLSAVMAIKHLAGKPETCKKAADIFENVTEAVVSCPRSRGLFYDRMSQVISEARNLDQNFLEKITEKFEDILSNQYLPNKNTCSEDLEAKFGLNNAHEELSTLAINFVKKGEEKFGGIVPVLFRALRMCVLRGSENDSLHDINALLGTSLILPKDLTSPEPSTLDYMIYSINWFREVISGFVKESDSTMQRQVLKRLDDLMTMQGEFQLALSICDSRYQPPQAYFHYFPPKPFVKVDKKASKKGKKGASEKSQTVAIPEWESFDLGSLLTLKNPTYFRRLDTKVAHLLDVKMDMTLTQTSSQAVSIAQVCFIIKELLGMIENDNSETLIYDLIQLLPQICNKLEDIVQDLRENEIDDSQKREAVNLLLRLISQIFSWKELFHSAKYNNLLRDGLRSLASQIKELNSSLNSIRELASESYKYFSMMRDVAANRSIVLAHNIVNVCETLMKHSNHFMTENKGMHATMAYDFLKSDDWLDKQTGAAYRNAIAGLLKTWMDNEPSPLKAIREVMEWLGDDVELLEKPTDCLKNLPSINKNNFPLLFKKVLEGLIKGLKIELEKTNSDSEKIEIWKDVGLKVKEITKISKMLKTRVILIISVRHFIILLRIFLNQGFLSLENCLKTKIATVTETLANFQAVTRYLHHIYCQGMNKTDTVLLAHFPAIKSLVEEFVCRVKAMMGMNNCLECFSTGNLRKRDINGHFLDSQSSADDSENINADLPSISDGTESRISEILQTDLEDDLQDDLNLDESAAEENLEEEVSGEENEDINIDSI